MKLAGKIRLSVFIVAFVCAAAGFTCLYFIAKNHIIQEIEASLESTARSRAAHIETYLAMLKSSVGQLSKSVVLEIFLKAAANAPLRPTSEFETAMTRLRRTKEANPAIYEFLLLDKTGRVIAATDEKSIGTDKSADAYYLGGQKEVFIKDAYHLESINVPLIAAAAPLEDSLSKEFLGVIVARVKLHELNAICAERTGLGETGEIYILNKSGFMITPSRFLKDTFLKQKVETENISQARLHAGREHVLSNRLMIFQDYRNREVLGTHKHIPGLQWILMVEIETQEAFAPLNAIILIYFVILLLIFMIAWLAASIVARTITRPLVKLHKGTEIIGAGNLDYKVGTDANDEVGQLSRAFDAMTENLKTSTTSVENLNRETAARKRTEENLKKRTAELFESEEDLAITLRSIGDALIATDAEGRVTKMNPVAETMTGWPLAEASGKPLSRIFHIINVQTRQPVADPVALVLEKGKIVGLANHTALIARDGTEYQIADSAAPIRDPEGRIRGVVLVFHDVSAEYQIRNALQESEEKHRAVVERANDGIIILQDGIIEYSNPCCAAMLGYETAEVQGMDLLHFIPRNNLTAIQERYRKRMAGEQLTGVFETVLINKNGEERFVETNGSLIQYEGKPAAIIIIRDITERKKLIALLESKTLLLETQMETSVDGILTVDNEGRAILFNKRFGELWRIPQRVLDTKDDNAMLEHIQSQLKDPAEFIRGVKYLYEHQTEKSRDEISLADGRAFDRYSSPLIGADGKYFGRTWFFRDITERKQAAAQLREANIILERSPSVAFLWKNEEGWPVEFVSNNIEILFGYTAEDFLSGFIRYTKIIHPNDINRVMEEVASHSKKNSPARFTHQPYRIIAKNGGIKWINDETYIRKNTNGDITHYEGIVNDITERKQAEIKLLQSEEKHRLLIENSHDIIYTLTPDGVFTFVSPSWTIFLGHPAAEVVGKSIRMFIHPEDIAKCMAALLAGVKTGQRQENVEYRVRHADGSWRWHISNAVALKDESGAVTGIEGIARDVTERKLSDDKIRQAKEDWERTFDSVPDLICLIDNNKIITRMNRTMAATLGIKPEEAIGRKCYTCVHHTEQPPAFCPHLQLLNDGKEHQAEIRDENRGKWFHLTVSPLRNDAGSIIGVVHVARDITRRKETEEKLTKAKADLEKAYSQLQESFQLESKLTIQTQAASAAKSRFVANISHEIRTPLNGIIGICELLLETKMSNEQREYAHTINSSAAALLNIINATLDFSKIEAGKMKLEYINFKLSDILENIISVLAGSAAKKNNELASFIESDVPLNLNGDPGRLRQILINLIGNAIKFTHEGKVRVNVALAKDTEEDRSRRPGASDQMPKTGKQAGAEAGGHAPNHKSVYLRFSVRDTGIGIPADKTNLLFKAFSQVDASLARKFGGTGLGLAISKGLVEEMGGSIGVESVPGTGSTFWFIVPFAIQHPDAHPSEHPADSGNYFEKTPAREPQNHLQYEPGNRLRILVAEDNMANQMVILGILQQMGHSAVAVANGKEIVKTLETIPYDLVLMDIQMPEMDGLEAAAIIRDPRSAVLDHNIPILALTAHTMPEDREQCISAGMNGYITKPVSAKAIADAIANIASPGKPPSRQEKPLLPDEPAAVFDAVALSNRLSGDGALIREIINIFLDETPKKMRELGKSIEKQQRDPAIRLAHAIKGSAANVSGQKLHALALRIEKACDAADWREAETLFPRFNRQFEKLERAMREFLKILR